MEFTDMITTIGFPIAACIALGLFIYKMYNTMQQNNKDREEKLYTMLGKSQEQLDKLEETNSSFVRVLESFKEDQEQIKGDINEIKENIKSIPRRKSDYEVQV